MLRAESHLFPRETSVEDCALVASLMEALCAGRVCWSRPEVLALLYPGGPPVAVVVVLQ